jgi:hypothetical protein
MGKILALLAAGTWGPSLVRIAIFLNKKYPSKIIKSNAVIIKTYWIDLPYVIALLIELCQLNEISSRDKMN